jgi:hypothetical protein
MKSTRSSSAVASPASTLFNGLRARTERTDHERVHALAWFQGLDELVYYSRLLSPFSRTSTWDV